MKNVKTTTISFCANSDDEREYDLSFAATLAKEMLALYYGTADYDYIPVAIYSEDYELYSDDNYSHSVTMSHSADLEQETTALDDLIALAMDVLHGVAIHGVSYLFDVYDHHDLCAPSSVPDICGSYSLKLPQYNMPMLELIAEMCLHMGYDVDVCFDLSISAYSIRAMYAVTYCQNVLSTLLNKAMLLADKAVLQKEV